MAPQEGFHDGLDVALRFARLEFLPDRSDLPAALAPHHQGRHGRELEGGINPQRVLWILPPAQRNSVTAEERSHVNASSRQKTRSPRLFGSRSA